MTKDKKERMAQLEAAVAAATQSMAFAAPEMQPVFQRDRDEALRLLSELRREG